MRTATNEPERTCILTGRKGGRGELIRLALSPDGVVLPDPAAKAPGRGAWLGVDAQALSAAQASGRLRGALGRAFKGGAREVPADLAARVAAELERRTLETLGLAMKAGQLITGFERVLAAAKSGAAHLVLHASDAADDGKRKLDAALRSGSALQSDAGGAKSLTLPADRTRLSVAVGQGNVVHATVTNPGAAARIGAAAARWRAFCGLDDDDGAAVPAIGGAGSGDDGMRRTV